MHIDHSLKMNKTILKTISAIWILLLFITSCNLPFTRGNNSSQFSIPEAEVVFQVVVPEKIEVGSSVYLELLDEVTGFYFNPTRYEMNKSSDVGYLFRLPLPIGSTINYRYIKIKDSAISEFNSRNQAVISRKLIVDGPVLVQDLVAGWADTQFVGTTGKVTGQVIDAQNNAPVPDLVVSIAGIETSTLSDGTFIFPDIPVGIHNLVILSKDGSYSPFQQYAKVAEHATTPVMVHLIKRDKVEITFELSNADLAAKNVDVRIAGNIAQLGNRFKPLLSGSPDLASELPIMTKTGKKTYSSTISLPVGAYVKYKYTLGDGFWNSESYSNGSFRTREFIVPDVNTTIEDKDVFFNSIGRNGIVFRVTVPKDTPASDTIFVQFNIFNWMEPIPMKKTGEFTWEYTLSSPINLFSQINYRYCRNGDCEKGLSINSPFSAKLQTEVLTTNDVVDGWVNFSSKKFTANIDTGGNFNTPRTDFITGYELTKQLPSTWQSSIQNNIDDISQLGANWVFLSPSWVVSIENPPIFDSNSSDLSWLDEQKIINYVKSSKMEPILFPQLITYELITDPNGNITNENWSHQFIEQYSRFIYNYADLAQIMGVKAIVLGDPVVSRLAGWNDQSQTEWAHIINGVRARFSGIIIGAYPVPNTNKPPEWLSETDVVYVLFSPTIIDQGDMINEMSDQLNTLVFPISEKFAKPIIIGTNFGSNELALTGCTDNSGSCFDQGEIYQKTDLTLQASLYNAISVNAFSKPWIIGLISRGYYPFLLVNDSGPSTYGKPANDILWFWFHFIRNLSS